MADDFQSKVQVIFEAVNRANAELERTRKQIQVISDSVKQQQQATGPLVGINEKLKAVLGDVNSKLAGNVAQYGALGQAAAGALGPVAAVAGAVTISVGAMISASRGIADYVESLDLASNSTGLTTAALAGMGVAAAENGRSFEQIKPALDVFARRIGEAASGSKEAAAAFGDLGVRIKDSGGNIRITDDILRDVQRSISSIEDPTLRSKAAFDVFGRSALMSLTALLTPLDQSIDRARRLGIALGPEAERVARQADAAFDSMKMSVQGITNAFGVLSATIMGPFLTSMATATAKVAEFVNSPYTQAFLMLLKSKVSLPGLPDAGYDQETVDKLGKQIKDDLFEKLRSRGDLPAEGRTGYERAIGPSPSVEFLVAQMAIEKAAETFEEAAQKLVDAIMAGGSVKGGTMYDLPTMPVRWKGRRRYETLTEGGGVYADQEKGKEDAPKYKLEDVEKKTGETLKRLGSQLEGEFASFVSSAVLGIHDLQSAWLSFRNAAAATIIETGVKAILPFAAQGGTFVKMAGGGAIGRVSSGMIGTDTQPALFQYGETTITKGDTDMLHDALIRNRLFPQGSSVNFHRGSIVFQGVFANEQQLEEFTDRIMVPRVVTGVRRAIYRGIGG